MCQSCFLSGASSVLFSQVLFGLLSQYVDIQVFNFLWCEYRIVSMRLHNDAAGHFEEHGSFEYLIEVASAYHLSVIGQED